VAADVEPHLILIDHTTGEIATLEGRPVEELASTLVEQAHAMRTAAICVPPGDAEPE
jgi:deoxyribose-phosphate aldolase